MSRRDLDKNKRNYKVIACLFIVIIFVIAVILTTKKFGVKNVDNAGKNGGNTVSDSVAPELNLDVEKTVVAIGEYYKVKATATDDVDGDITSRIQHTDIDTSKAGEYDVTVFVTDNAGNKTEKVQKVIVREELQNGLPVLMYHFFYDDIQDKMDNNCLDINMFESQLKYMTENDYYFPTWDEVNDYIDGKFKLPSKSVVLTVDDGNPTFFMFAVPMLQKYHVPATSFVILDMYPDIYDPTMDYVIWESHSVNMHQAGANGKGRMVNWTHDQILEDLNESSERLGNANIFCYPFGHYNDTAISALKDSPFIMAFTVEGGRVKVGMDKYKLPRVRVSDGNSLDYFIKSIA